MLAFAAAALSALSIATLASAQDTTIQVGAEVTSQGGVYQFIPNQINATAGSVITFNFTGSPGNHTVTQSSAADPCNPLSGGFDSGYIFVPPNSTTGFPTWNLTVLDVSKPIWFFCAQRLPSPHCYNGMIGAINAPATGANNFTGVQDAAKALLGNANGTQPGLPTPALSGSGAAASAAPGPLTGSFVGVATPTGSLSVAAPSAASSGAPGSPTTGGAPSPTNTPSAAGMNAVVSLSAVVLAALSCIALM